MGIVSPTTSLTRYCVNGRLDEPVLDIISAGLKKYAIGDIDGNPSEQTAGWTGYKDPFNPDFEGSSFVLGAFILFSLRVDKKSIPSKMVQKHFAVESAKRMKEMERDFLSANEKKMIKDHVINTLNLKIPSTPNIFDVVWQVEKNELWFFSNLKSANEHLETLFAKSFHLHLVRRIPYTMAFLDKTLTPAQLDVLAKIAPEEGGT
jgi:recombination associated protein RdgC